MAIILDFYKENKSNSNEIKKAEEYLLKNTLSANLIGDDKIKEIDGMDMESKLSGRIIPSMIYTFIYDTNKEKQKEGEIIFGDNLPIVLCCDVKPIMKILNGKVVNGLSIIGINLNFISNEERAIVLNAIYNAFSNFYNNIYKEVYDNRVAINKGLISLVTNKDFIKNIKAITNVDISKCVRSYNLSFAKNIRLIEYNLWKYIPLYDAKRTITNATIQQIQKIMSKK